MKPSLNETIDFERILEKHGLTPAAIIQMPDVHPDQSECHECDGYGHIIVGNAGRPCPRCRGHYADWLRRKRGKGGKQ